MRVAIHERALMPAPPEPVFDRIASEQGFLMFEGFGPIPGLARIVFEQGGYRETGSEARVTNTDGSTHREQITTCEPPHRYAVQIHSLSSAFRLLVSRIDESWELTSKGDGTEVRRTFAFTLRSPLFWPASLLLAQVLFRAAIRRNHRALARAL